VRSGCRSTIYEGGKKTVIEEEEDVQTGGFHPVSFRGLATRRWWHGGGRGSEGISGASFGKLALLLIELENVREHSAIADKV
jgi:hypothetical protein